VSENNFLNLIHRYQYLTDSIISEKNNHNESLLIKNIKNNVGHIMDSTNSDYLNANNKLDLRKLVNIISVNQQKKTITVESGCSMEQLFDFSFQYGMIPKVLPEFKDITVGGAIVGAALESSSFKFGQFNDICKNILVLCGDGKIIKCSKTENADLFYSLSGSYGTLCTVLCAEIECIEATSNVLLNISCFENTLDGLNFMKKTLENNIYNIDFLEAIQYPPLKSTKNKKISNTFNETNNLGSIAVISSQLINKNLFLDNKKNNNNYYDFFDVEKNYEEWFFEKVFKFFKKMNNNNKKNKLDSPNLYHVDNINNVNYNHKNSNSFNNNYNNNNKNINNNKYNNNYNNDNNYNINNHNLNKNFTATNHTLTMPLKSFLFRYNRGAFWMARPTQFSFKLVLKNPLLLLPFFLTQNNFICRFLFRKMFTTRSLYKVLKKVDQGVVLNRMIIMDVITYLFYYFFFK
jgi:hypothetical protein